MITNNKKAVAPFGAVPTERQIFHMELEKKAFFHFGMNTFTNAEWGDGSECESAFAPSAVDTRQWIRGAAAAGFKLAIITVKHHDGFCLWPSAYTEHTIANSPYMGGRADIIRDFTDACREYGLRVGLYISPWDRNSRFWGTDEYSLHYARQLEELTTGYGHIDEIWWDGAGSSETVYNWELWYDIIKKNQPQAIMFGSMGATDYVSIRWVGNECGYTAETHYASIDPESLRVENVDELCMGKIGGERYIPAEVDVSIRPGWFYHADQTSKVKSATVLDDIWFNSVGRNAMMLLNFPPNRDGVVDDIDFLRARESNDRIERMRAVNLLDGARLMCGDEDISPVICSDSFYCTDDNEIEIDITLPTPREANVLTLSEVYELGERITEIELSDADSGEIIAHGTSVGRLRTVRFAGRSLKHLRLRIRALCGITVSSLALWKYDAPAAEMSAAKGEDLMSLSGAGKIVDNNMGYTVLSFGGIYDFNTVRFETERPAEYTLLAFDGSKFYKILDGVAADTDVTVSFPTVRGSYQMKIVSNEKFKASGKFEVYEK